MLDEVALLTGRVGSRLIGPICVRFPLPPQNVSRLEYSCIGRQVPPESTGAGAHG